VSRISIKPAENKSKHSPAALVTMADGSNLGSGERSDGGG